MNTPSDILILRTIVGGIAAIVKMMGYSKTLVRDEDYQTFTSADSALVNVYVTAKPQLLIVDSFAGDMAKSVEFVKTARERNPQLVVILFALGTESHPVFDKVVNYQHESWLDYLLSLINQLRKGELRHS